MPPNEPRREHKAHAPASVRCFVLTVSDTRTEATDTSGRAIADLLTAAGHTRRRPHDREGRCRAGARDASSGSSPAPTCRRSSPPAAPASPSRDSTYEASAALLQKRLDGFGELFRMLSFEEIGPAAMMSRACAGLAAGRIVVSLPGSEAAVRLAMERLRPTGSVQQCGAIARFAAGVGDRSNLDRRSPMRPFTSTISLDEARRRLDAHVRPIARTERVRLDDAAGRVAARRRHVADRRAAVRAIGDGRLRRRRRRHRRRLARRRPCRLRLLDRIYTGAAVDGQRSRAGTCAEIATGAPLPAGADAVVMVEETARAGGDGRSRSSRPRRAGPARRPPRRRHRRRRSRRRRRRSADARAASARSPPIGRADVEVFAKPRVAILSTGNEVVEPGAPLAPGQIFDVNRFTLGAIVSAHGGIPEPHRAGAGHGRRARSRALDELRRRPT